MDDGPYWVILLMYESHEMRHTGFPQVNCGQQDPRGLGCHSSSFHAASTVLKHRLPFYPLTLGHIQVHLVKRH